MQTARIEIGCARSPEPVTITVNTALQQFEAAVGRHKAVLQYHLRDDNSIVFTHTEVPYQVQGRGIGSALARAALDFARERSLRVIPLCPFVEQYIKKHPDYLPLVESTFRANRFAEASE